MTALRLRVPLTALFARRCNAPSCFSFVRAEGIALTIKCVPPPRLPMLSRKSPGPGREIIDDRATPPVFHRCTSNLRAQLIL